MTIEQKDRDEGIQALMYADIKKLIKYFKLDRKSKSNSDDPDGASAADEDGQLLREALELIKEISKSTDRKDFIDEQKAVLKSFENAVKKVLSDYRDTEHTEHSELKAELEKIGQALDALKTEKRDNVVHHRHAIEIASSKVFLSIIGMGLLILGLAYVIGEQRRTIDRFRDNDLKYRYVKMHGEATPGDIKALEAAFTYDRNPDSVKLIRRQVVQYERLVKEQAERIEQARFNASEAERLRNEVETVKGGKNK